MAEPVSTWRILRLLSLHVFIPSLPSDWEGMLFICWWICGEDVTWVVTCIFYRTYSRLSSILSLKYVLKCSKTYLWFVFNEFNHIPLTFLTFDLPLILEPSDISRRFAARGHTGQSDLISLHQRLGKSIDLWFLRHTWIFRRKRKKERKMA